jgi:hypothetical protein
MRCAQLGKVTLKLHSKPRGAVRLALAWSTQTAAGQMASGSMVTAEVACASWSRCPTHVNWVVAHAALIALVGAMLIYGAQVSSVRPLVWTVAGLSKVFFVGLLVAHGQPYLSRAGLAVGVDRAMVVLFAMYLATSASAAGRRAASGRG